MGHNLNHYHNSCYQTFAYDINFTLIHIIISEICIIISTTSIFDGIRASTSCKKISNELIAVDIQANLS